MAVRIWVRGGLGNQLCSLAAGAFVAGLQGDPELILDGSVVANSQDPSRRYYLDQILLLVPGLQIVHDNAIKSRKGTASRLTRKVVSTLHRRSLIRGVIEYLPEHGTSLLNLTKQVRFMDGHYEVPQIAFSLLTLGLPPTVAPKQASAEVRHAATQIRPSDLAVHVRLGDFRTHLRGSLMLDGAYYRRAIESASDLGGFDQVKVFSEEPEIAVSLLRSAVGAKVRISPVPVRSPHESLYEMSRYHGLVASRSSFSWWAGVLGPSRTVVGPADSDFFRYAEKECGWTLIEP